LNVDVLFFVDTSWRGNRMLSYRLSVRWLVFCAVLLSGPILIHLQPSRARSQQGSDLPALSEAETREARELYAKNCAQCHDANGTGVSSRKLFPETPDFTSAAWQAGRSDVQFLVSILEGKGTGMPGLATKLSQQQARRLVVLVRTFAPTKKTTKEKPPASKSPETSENPPASKSPSGSESSSETDNPSASFEERFRQLEKQFAEQTRLFKEASKAKVAIPPPKSDPPMSSDPPGNGDPSVDSKPPPTLSNPAVVAKAKPVESVVPADLGPPIPATPLTVEQLYLRDCAKCHAANGCGSTECRGLFPETPDFTDASWQIRRSEGQFLASILNGKGKGMPAYRDKISEDQARDLGAYVRAFYQPKKSLKPTTEVGSVNREDTDASLNFLEELVGWLGKFHRPAVHFPIALLVMAALAELLAMVTGKLSFDAASRYCIWVGTIMAVVAATLGWFLGGFQLTDSSWILTTHRWWGVATVACAGLVLILSEVSRQRPGKGLRSCFRLALLGLAAVVAVTGFFGGAVAFGMDHYVWGP
jgi:mono/diheme cytochrome c family protein/uncharacterized membrane protein